MLICGSSPLNITFEKKNLWTGCPGSQNSCCSMLLEEEEEVVSLTILCFISIDFGLQGIKLKPGSVSLLIRNL